MSGFAPFGANPVGTGDQIGINVDMAALGLDAYALGFTNIPLSTYALELPPIVLPLQPETTSFALGTAAPFTVGVKPEAASFGLAAITPQIWSVQHEAAIEFRHAPLVPWVMPMTQPVYPPAASGIALAPLVPSINIRGLWAPPDMIFGWSYDSGTDTISIPLSSLFELTAGQADPATGDWRAVVLALLNTMWDAYIELDDPPQAIQLSYSPGYVMQNGALAGMVKTEYTAVTYLTFPEKYLADEP